MGDEVLHQTAPILLWDRPAREADVHLRAGRGGSDPRPPQRPATPEHFLTTIAAYREDLVVAVRRGGRAISRPRGLGSGSRRRRAIRGQRREEACDFWRPHLGGMTLGVKENVPANPRDVGFFGAPAVVPRSQRVANTVEETWSRRVRRAGLTDDEGTSDRTAVHSHRPFRSGRSDDSPSESSGQEAPRGVPSIGH